jgi:hypothetical protein
MTAGRIERAPDDTEAEMSIGVPLNESHGHSGPSPPLLVRHVDEVSGASHAKIGAQTRCSAGATKLSAAVVVLRQSG